VNDPTKKEQLSLDASLTHILEECRMVLPGIQALFGFQLIAVFNDGFTHKLSITEQQMHYAAIILTVIAVALVMTPAAIHLQVDPLAVTERFIRSSSILLLSRIIPLAISICLEIYLIGQIISRSFWLGYTAALGCLLFFTLLWLVLPHAHK
jgi:hypothetical protein